METDLEVVIKDTTIVLTQPNIKSFMIMALTGLEYLHSLWVLHRVCIYLLKFVNRDSFSLTICLTSFAGFKAKQFIN